MQQVCFNGHFLPTGQPLISASNASFKWGDGLFETMKFSQGHIRLEQLHFERLFAGMDLLEMNRIDLGRTMLLENISALCGLNGLSEARVRLAVYREAEGTGYAIEAIPLDPVNHHWQEEGLHLGIYPHARKSQDIFSNLKSANFLPYVMAGLYAKSQHFDDVLLLNASGNICDSTKANIFLVKNEVIRTPSLSEGCINGVMRRHLLESLPAMGWKVEDGTIAPGDLEQADEIFRTNAIYGIRSVTSFNGKALPSVLAKAFYHELMAAI
jgi:branched-chain amino acid aminotransferase